jgi:prophage maintenance system killer protein
MARRDHHFDVNRGELETIFKGLDQFRGIHEHRTRILSMAAWILYRIAERRPFYDGNKHSAWVMSTKFFNWNGYRLITESPEQKRELHRLLTGVQRHSKGFDDVKVYMNRATITFRSR